MLVHARGYSEAWTEPLVLVELKGTFVSLVLWFEQCVSFEAQLEVSEDLDSFRALYSHSLLVRIAICQPQRQRDVFHDRQPEGERSTG